MRTEISKQFYPGRMVSTEKKGAFKVISGSVLAIAENGLDVIVQTPKKREVIFHALLNPVEI